MKGASVADQVPVTVPPEASQVRKLVMLAPIPLQAPVPLNIPICWVEKTPLYEVKPVAWELV